MPLANTRASYGGVTKTFHWLTALLILSAIPLGLIASDLAHEIQAPGAQPTEAQITRTALLFSLHKTLGVTVFFVALLRILWAISQPKPGLLNGDRLPEAMAAHTVHWLLYGSLLFVPLSGWVHHAATTGFAPIWWPFGQSLPFVPKDEGVAEISGTVHYILQWVLIGAIALHVAGALKHHVIDRDATLRRMLPGHRPAEPSTRQPGHVACLVVALAIWGAALGGGAALGWFSHAQAESEKAALAAVESDWAVQSGRLDIAVQQMGSEVTGSFAEWTADIAYSEAPDAEGRHGDVTVTVSIPSLTLGSVTKQAMGPDYFAAEQHPTATFAADILATDEGGHVARGTLTIKENAVPVEIPFALTLEGDTAEAQGSLTVDRRDFGIALGTKDEGTLAFGVDISFTLTAERQ
ncbi:MAG: cytochrome b/b6 domain-containing protein [Roseovarius sp.]